MEWVFTNEHFQGCHVVSGTSIKTNKQLIWCSTTQRHNFVMIPSVVRKSFISRWWFLYTSHLPRETGPTPSWLIVTPDNSIPIIWTWTNVGIVSYKKTDSVVVNLMSRSYCVSCRSSRRGVYTLVDIQVICKCNPTNDKRSWFSFQLQSRRRNWKEWKVTDCQFWLSETKVWWRKLITGQVEGNWDRH